MMTRRRLLRGVGLAGLGGLAGCTGFTGGSTPTSSPDSSEPSDRDVPPDATGRVAVASVDERPDLPVSPRVSLADPFFTTGSPAVLRVNVDNPGDDPVTIGEYREVVFQYVSSGDGSYLLLPHSERSTDGEPDRAVPDYDTESDCWQLTDRIAVTEEYGTVEIPASGTLTAFVGLYATVDASGCRPTGEYSFEATYAAGALNDERTDAPWGFTLAVESL